MMKKVLSIIIVGLLVFSCNNNVSETKGNDTVAAATSPDTLKPLAVATGDNSRTSVDWPGTYRGILPCADCQGIETIITITSDSAYGITTHYLGKAGARSIDSKGSFSWNDAGNTITLAGTSNAPSQYLVGENALIQLDLQGKRIEGELADKYRLKKQTASDTTQATLVETCWKLTELNGKPINPGDNQKEIHLILKNKDNRAQGSSGCNSYSGTYELKEGNRIRFSQVAGTLMACPKPGDEAAYLKMLLQVDNYNLKGSTLQLNKAKMAPLAKFEAVYLK